MAKLIMMVGIAGSGKSTLGGYNTKAVVVSSDAIREELYGDREIQDDPGKVFQILHQRVKAALREGKTVIYDATNLSEKRRKGFLDEIKNIPDVEKECSVVLADLSECYKRRVEGECKKNSEKLGRPLTEEEEQAIMHKWRMVIGKQVRQFDFPSFSEGWDIISISRTTPKFYIDDFYKKLFSVEQTGKYHLEDAGRHSMLVEERAREIKNEGYFVEAARYHDIGKVICHSIDEEGNHHFYGHDHAGAYLYALTISPGFFLPFNENVDCLKTLRLIQCHDNIYNNVKKFNSLPDDLKEDLIKLHECDQYGTIAPEDMRTIPLLKLIKAFPNWKEILSKEPFFIDIKQEGDLYLFKYQQLNSDFSIKAVQESRGCIIEIRDNSARYVCRPFDKFFNYGEEQAAEIDWKTARILAKLDGSLTKVWFDNGEWHLSTNGTVNAFTAQVSDTNLTFGKVFERALGYSVAELGKHLDKEYTYMFELTSPDTRVVIQYPDGVYYLSRRHTQSGKEEFDRLEVPNLKYPRSYPLRTLDEVVNAALKLGKDEEGFVVNDASSHRIKVKGPEYLIASKLTANHNLSTKSLYRIVMEGKEDDMLAYAPEYIDRISHIKTAYKEMRAEIESEWEKYKDSTLDKKSFALLVNKEALPYTRGYIFKKKNVDPNYTVDDYLNNMFEYKKLMIIKSKLPENERVEDDISDTFGDGGDDER